jgi:threonyl-tRNA synthetase
MDVPFVEVADEAAFYGPKVDVQFKSVIGREETMSTIQLDFIAKTRFGLTYVDETGAENNDVFVIHRAPLSTHERFTAFLIEHFAGAFPVWLSPVQVHILAVGEKHHAYCEDLGAQLRAAGLRVEVNTNDDTVGNKIRKAATSKVPYMLVVGDQEMDAGTLAVRKRGSRDTTDFSVEEFMTHVNTLIATKSREL